VPEIHELMFPSACFIRVKRPSRVYEEAPSLSPYREVTFNNLIYHAGETTNLFPLRVGRKTPVHPRPDFATTIRAERCETIGPRFDLQTLNQFQIISGYKNWVHVFLLLRRRVLFC